MKSLFCFILGLAALAWLPAPARAGEDFDEEFRQLNGQIVSGDFDTEGNLCLEFGDGTSVCISATDLEDIQAGSGLWTYDTGTDELSPVSSTATLTIASAGLAASLSSTGGTVILITGGNSTTGASLWATGDSNGPAIRIPTGTLWIEGKSSNPSTPQEGEVAYNTTDHMARFWDGSAWVDMSGDGGGGYNQLQEEGSNITARTTLDFVGSTATVADTGSISRLTFDSDVNAVASLSSNGLVARTGSGSVSARTLTAPAAGITVSNGDGVSGNPTLALANDLSALEGLSSSGLAKRTGTDTWAIAAAGTDYVAPTTAATRSARFYWKDFVLPTTSPAADNGTTVMTTNEESFKSFTFSFSATNYVQVPLVLPDNYNSSTLTVTFYWLQAGTGTGNVVWQADARSFADAETMDATWGTAQTVTDAAPNDITKLNISSATAALTPAGSAAPGELLILRLARLGADAADTLNRASLLVAVKVEYGINNYSE